MVKRDAEYFDGGLLLDRPSSIEQKTMGGGGGVGGGVLASPDDGGKL